jgi:hypothetical protein
LLDGCTVAILHYWQKNQNADADVQLTYFSFGNESRRLSLEAVWSDGKTRTIQVHQKRDELIHAQQYMAYRLIARALSLPEISFIYFDCKPDYAL